MDATKFGESNYITAQLIEQSKTKTAVIIGDSTSEETDYGEKLTVPVEIDGKKKTYRPNKDSVKNIIEELGSETSTWIGSQLSFSLFNFAGKQCVNSIVKKEK